MAGRIGKTIYNRAPWRRLRLAAREAAGGRCQVCAVWCWADGECHHLDPLARNGAAIPPLDGVKWICKKCHFASHHPHHERHAWDRLLVGLRFPEPVSSMTSRTHPDRGARVRPAGRSFNRPRGGVFCAERVSKVGRDLFDPVSWRSRLSP